MRQQPVHAHHLLMTSWQQRFRAAGIHLGISLLVASLAATVVFNVWYPFPYREISGGRELFSILVAVDVVLGPLLTLAIFNRAKPSRELRNDLVIVALLQLAGLGYGLWTVAVARPVHLVFEIDRFRVVHAIDVPSELLSSAPGDVVALPWTGPTLLAVRPFVSETERMQATMVALKGIPLGARPDLWQSYPSGRMAVLAAARPLNELKSRFAQQAALIDTAVAATRRAEDVLLYVPLAARKSFWTVLIDSTSADVLGFIPLDSF